MKGLTLAIFFVDFRRYNVCFCFTSNENCHFSSEKTVRPQNGLLIFFGKETHSEKTWKSSRSSHKTSHNNNGRQWKSSRILRVKANFFIFSSFIIFFIFLLLIFSFLFLFLFWVARNTIFCGLNCFTLSFNISDKKNFLEPSREEHTPLRPLFMLCFVCCVLLVVCCWLCVVVVCCGVLWCVVVCCCVLLCVACCCCYYCCCGGEGGEEREESLEASFFLFL